MLNHLKSNHLKSNKNRKGQKGGGWLCATGTWIICRLDTKLLVRLLAELFTELPIKPFMNEGPVA